jgi:hypothetical protein
LRFRRRYRLWSPCGRCQESVGNQGLQFSSVGGWVYAQALKAGKGRAIPTEWFLQDIRE